MRKFFLVFAVTLWGTLGFAQQFPLFKVIGFYSETVEQDHIDFAHEAVSFFENLTAGGGILFDSCNSLNNMTYEQLKKYDIVIFFNDSPTNPKARKAFERYMEEGGAWYGFHYAAYNDKNTQWPWFVNFLGGTVFHNNNWPVMPAKLIVDDPLHAVCRTLPDSFIAPTNEWYQWEPSPRLNDNVDVLLTLSPEVYPLGYKAVLREGDIPVVWTNTQYRMIYMNMGHGKGLFADPTQNTLFINALTWLSKTDVNRKELAPTQEKVVVAYVFYRSEDQPLPDPSAITHINFAFGHVNETFDGVYVPQPKALHNVANLTEVKPSLKVLLSIGGWGSGRFSEMASDPVKRASFARDCKRVIDEYHLAGVDFDWEYPSTGMANISAAPEDTRNFTLLMKEVRQAIGPEKLLTIATSASGKYIAFNEITSSVDFVNIMCYDFVANEPLHHSGLYPSSLTGEMSCYESVLAHVRAGFPIERLVLGIPFYGKGVEGFPRVREGMSQIEHLEGYTACWDDIAKGPYLKDKEGKVVFCYDNPRSVGYKCAFIHKYGLKGAMYWAYGYDDFNESMRWAVYNGVMDR